MSSFTNLIGAREANENGACNLRSHQRQICPSNREIQVDLNLQTIDAVIRLNSDTIVRNIRQLMRSRRREAFGFIYVYTLPGGNIKIGRTGQDDPRDRWSQQRQYPTKAWLK